MGKEELKLASPPAAGDPVLWALLALATGLLFWSLAGRKLWEDEAETARLGQTTLVFGRPLAYDGRNLVSQEAGREFGRDFVWRWSPWVQFYIVAASFKLLGPSTFAARLPFALIGVATVYGTYVLAQRLFGSRALARLSALLLTLSVPFLLHARQCRWHAPAFLAAVLFVLFAAELVGRRRVGRTWTTSAVGFLAAGTILFYTNYFAAVAFFSGTALALMALRPGRTVLLRTLPLWLALAILCVPGVVYFALYVMNQQTGTGPPGELSKVLWRMADQLDTYLVWFSFYCLTPISAGLMVWMCLRERGEAWLGQQGGLQGQAPVLETWRAGVLFLIAVCAGTVIVVALGPWAFFRYLSIVLPLGAILTAVPLLWLWARSRSAAVVGVVLLLGCDALGFPALLLVAEPAKFYRYRFPAQGLRLRGTSVSFPLAGYLTELLHPPYDADSALCDYLRAHASLNDVLMVSNGDLALQFYTQCRVVGGLQNQALWGKPEWIVPRHFFVSSEPGKDLGVIHWMQQNVDLKLYDKTELPVLDLAQTACPEPRFHRFQLPQPPVPEGRLLTIYRRKDMPDRGSSVP